ncbi:hypothetical protein [Sphingobium sp. CFD-2]|uniref:hypothetical protein n=1 Tax=Sphingobium sp. CFD-2 TaxID=2878542 RepID=UPI00214AA87D|nr:hypothetical protein [Sphingobium sp. CFD-2]
MHRFKIGMALLLVASSGLAACYDERPGRHRPPRHDRDDRYERHDRHGEHRGDRDGRWEGRR